MPKYSPYVPIEQLYVGGAMFPQIFGLGAARPLDSGYSSHEETLSPLPRDQLRIAQLIRNLVISLLDTVIDSSLFLVFFVIQRLV
jgi:hypothetical protein